MWLVRVVTSLGSLSKWSGVWFLTLVYGENLVGRGSLFNVVQYFEGLVSAVACGGQYPEEQKKPSMVLINIIFINLWVIKEYVYIIDRRLICSKRSFPYESRGWQNFGHNSGLCHQSSLGKVTFIYILMMLIIQWLISTSLKRMFG